MLKSPWFQPDLNKAKHMFKSYIKYGESKGHAYSYTQRKILWP